MRSVAYQAVFTLVVLAGCSQPTPSNLQAIAPSTVIGVEVKESERIIFDTRNRTVAQFATDSHGIFRQLKKHFETDYKSVPLLTVRARADLENQSGESFQNEPIFEVTWSRGELDTIDFSKNLNVFTQDLLARANQVESFNLAGDFVLTDYCMTANAQDTQEVFCDKVIAGLYNK
ncbi:MAG: hypothetical protein R3194_06755 [Limnobacter sp.]|nr:hypothetical protein [Limnobacter sp.]